MSREQLRDAVNTFLEGNALRLSKPSYSASDYDGEDHHSASAPKLPHLTCFVGPLTVVDNLTVNGDLLQNYFEALALCQQICIRVEDESTKDLTTLGKIASRKPSLISFNLTLRSRRSERFVSQARSCQDFGLWRGRLRFS